MYTCIEIRIIQFHDHVRKYELVSAPPKKALPLFGAANILANLDMQMKANRKYNE